MQLFYPIYSTPYLSNSHLPCETQPVTKVADSCYMESVAHWHPWLQKKWCQSIFHIYFSPESHTTIQYTPLRCVLTCNKLKTQVGVKKWLNTIILYLILNIWLDYYITKFQYNWLRGIYSQRSVCLVIYPCITLPLNTLWELTM